MNKPYSGTISDTFNLITANIQFDGINKNIFTKKMENFLIEKNYYVSNYDIEQLIQKENDYIIDTKKISFLPLDKLNSKEEMLASKIAMDEIIHKGHFTSGPQVTIFENEVNKFFQSKYCIGTGSGTDALIISLLSCSIGNGDEVILPANSFAATENAVLAIGATPVFIDVENDFNISVAHIERSITNRTKAILPVCLYGKMPKLSEIKKLVEHKNIFVITDAAQCFGVVDILKYSDLVAFSFNPFKNYGVFGKGGAIITNNDVLADKCRTFSYHGFAYGKKNFKSGDYGLNSRLDNLQAAIALAKAQYVSLNMLKRSYLAFRYCNLLKDASLTGKITIPEFTQNNSWHLYPILMNKLELVPQLINFAKNKYNVELEKYYPVLAYNHETMFNAKFYNTISLKNTELLHKRVIHLPLHNHMSLLELEKIVEVIYDFIQYT